MTETLPDIPSSSPHLKWKYRVNEETGETELEKFYLSDGDEISQQKFLEALKNSTGSTDLEVGHRIIRDTANILSAESIEEKLNKASAMLSALHPKDETEAMLLGQFLALRDSGMGCLKRAQNQDMINHFEKLLILTTKLFNTANQTMQILTKYRSGGQQKIQVVYLHNEGQAIVAQNLSEGDRKKKS